MKFQLDSISYEVHPEETLLDALLRHNIEISSGCRSGICRSCLVRSPGFKKDEWQRGLSPDEVKKGYFYSCQAKLSEDLDIFLGEGEEDKTSAEVVKVEDLGGENYRIIIRPENAIEYLPGQYLNLYRPDGLFRPYSLASLPGDETCEFHIRVLEGGEFSSWIKTVSAGQDLKMGPASGDCVLPEKIDEPRLILIGTGTGLAPLYGLLQEALLKGYNGQIHLYHGSRYQDGLYLDSTLRTLSEQHDSFEYIPCLSGESKEGYEKGRVNEVVLAKEKEFKDTMIYLCGHPEMIREMKKRAFLNGANLQKMKSDAFFLQNPSS